MESLLPRKQSAPSTTEGKLQNKSELPISLFKTTNSNRFILCSFQSGHPVWFLQTISKIMSSTIPTPKSPTICFNLSQETAVHNMKIIQAYGNSIHNYLLSQTDTYIGFGSEF
jgi:hypothetical protein